MLSGVKTYFDSEVPVQQDERQETRDEDKEIGLNEGAFQENSSWEGHSAGMSFLGMADSR